PGRRIRVGPEDVAPVAERRGGERQHAAELAVAEDADGGAGRDHAPASSGASGTAAVCRARQSASAAATAGRCSDTTAAAGRAALTAPARPIASVRTGTPAGIYTIDGGLSSPYRLWLWIGTPNTGSAVIAATMPGRCA